MSIFSKIVSGEISSYKIYEDKNNIAFLDIFPMSKGHVLVVPKKEIDYIFDMSNSEYNQLLLLARRLRSMGDQVYDQVIDGLTMQ